MKRPLLLAFLIVLTCASLALAAPKFPKLTGRVVDEAHVLSPGIHDRLEQKLADYEAASKSQVVVATLKSLQGMEIQDYGYQLGRAWGIGQKGKDNGVLLVVAPTEHKVGIEVGYGHEGTLTDAQTGLIIHDTILPEFRDGHIEQGIWKGTEAILAVLGGDTPPPPPVAQDDSPQLSNTAIIIILILVVIFCVRYPTLAWFIFANLPNSSYRGGSGGGRSGGGFSGGGGSFGGGGSSGSW